MILKPSPRAMVAFALITAVVTLLPPRTTNACGPFFTDAIFVFTKHPDFPLEQFANGRLGVVSPSWARSYLVVAYRNLSGAPLSKTEAADVKSLWDERLNLSSDGGSDDWSKQWNEARAKVPGTQPVQFDTYRNREKPNEYESFLNCQQDALKNAEALLSERITRFGADSAQVHDWLAAQDIVFLNCHEGQHIPQPVAAEAEQLVRADRAYQIAAANFYATNYDEARQQFDAIAKEKTSPYRIIAPYLAARAMLRKGSFAEKPEEKTAALTDAENRFAAILKDNSLARAHDISARLLNLTKLRLHPEAKLHDFAHTIAKPDASKNFKQDVWDYTVLMDSFLGDDSEGEQPSKKPVPESLKSDELTDWIVAMQESAEAAATHSLQRWEQSKSVVWLVAAMTNAKGNEAKAADLIAAAGRVEHSSPAFPSLAFHTARLLKESGRSDAARTYLDSVLTNDRRYLDASAANQLMSIRMLLAQNLDQFLQNVQRKPAGYSDDNDGREIPEDEKEAAETAKDHETLFDLDGANIFNKAMPAAIMKDAARSNVLAANLKRDVAQAAFMRAALIDDRESALQAAPILEGFYPELKEFLAAYQRAPTPDARRFSTAFMALKFPGLRPFVSTGVGRMSTVSEMDSYRDNYWCAEPPPALGGAPSEDESTKPKPVTAPEFLKASQTTAARQFATLQALGTAPNFLCQTAIDWTEKNPNDPRSPEALHLAVRSTRYGCTDKETGRLSKAAFDLLHRRYPNTKWANATKYWFKD
ncbi:MAG TPA: hypothetical protein VE969_09015 [Pyrinomonadaceae bacterium]|nr:hypothetical protein [Pyrinomonadaceae bacterium]